MPSQPFKQKSGGYVLKTIKKRCVQKACTHLKARITDGVNAADGKTNEKRLLFSSRLLSVISISPMLSKIMLIQKLLLHSLKPGVERECIERHLCALL